MGKERATIRQRGSTAAAAPPAQKQQQDAENAELTTAQKANFYFAQHIGLVVVVIGIALLWLGYDQGWMHNTTLCLLSLGICLVGLFFHELRPFNAQQIYEELKSSSEAAR